MTLIIIIENQLLKLLIWLTGLEITAKNLFKTDENQINHLKFSTLKCNISEVFLGWGLIQVWFSSSTFTMTYYSEIYGETNFASFEKQKIAFSTARFFHDRISYWPQILFLRAWISQQRFQT